MANFNWPPAPSLPENAPWTDVQKIQAYLYGILRALVPSISETPGTTPVTGATLSDVVDALNQIIYMMQNADGIQTLNVPVTTANQKIQFTGFTIPDGFPLVIQSAPANDPAGLILVTYNNGSLQYNVVSLRPGQFVQYRVKTTDVLYIVGTVVGDVVTLTAEKKSGG